MTNSCSYNPPKLEYINSVTLLQFPSGSAVEYNEGKLYVFGDDAPYLLILDTSYNELDRIRFLSDTNFRISKETKPDIESAALITNGNQKFLYALGSMSTPQRKKLYYFPVSDIRSHMQFDMGSISNTFSMLPELNIEGMAMVRSKMVLSNRANTTHRQNRIIYTKMEMGDYIEKKSFISTLLLDTQTIKGVSGLYYAEEKDILFFTASEEETPNAIEDGPIGESYLGWIRDFSSKMNDETLIPYHLIQLSDVHTSFAKQKIESVCVEKTEGQQMILHLIADNDDGKSVIFKVRLTL